MIKEVDFLKKSLLIFSSMSTPLHAIPNQRPEYHVLLVVRRSQTRRPKILRISVNYREHASPVKNEKQYMLGVLATIREENAFCCYEN